jgi:TonB family protein
MLKTFMVVGLVSCSLALFAQQEQTIYDEEISVSDFEKMAYPALARAGHHEGVVVVRARLDAKGYATSVTAISGSAMLVPDVISNAKKWRFKPNSKGAAVLVYQFRIVDGTCDPANGSLFVLKEPNVVSITMCSFSPQPSTGFERDHPDSQSKGPEPR